MNPTKTSKKRCDLGCSGRVCSCCSISGTRCATNPVIKTWTRKGSDCDYDKRNISVVICDTDIP